VTEFAGSQVGDGSSPSSAERSLIDAGVPYIIAPPVEGAQSLEDFAERSGIRAAQVLKSLLLDIDGHRYAMLLAPGDRSADFAALRRYFGARSVRLADRDVVEAVTGYRIGTVTPLGAKTPGLPILIDEMALREELVSLGTGRSGRHVRIAPANLVQALGAVVGPFARPMVRSS
jgi:Cys-tRNA(Pro) deacylase